MIIILNKIKSNKPKFKILEESESELESESDTSEKDHICENRQETNDKFRKTIGLGEDSSST